MNKKFYERERERVKSKRGFTLIELLVVISIIGFLATASMVVFNSVRMKARDTSRKASLKQIQTALNLYFDANSAYPSTGGAYYSSEPGDNNSNNGGNYIPGLAPTYIAILPRDPRGGNSPLCAGGWKESYHYKSDGTNYKLLSHCAPEGSWTSSDPFYDPVRPTFAWMLCSANATVCNTW